MKKFLTAMVAGATLFSAGAAFAANQVQMTLTSPTILKSGCEKAGSTTFSFDQDSQLKAGDWWYMDLPTTVTICKDIDYFITGGNSNGVFPAASALVKLNGAGDNITLGGAGGAADNLPTSIDDTWTGPITATKLAGATAQVGYYMTNPISAGLAAATPAGTENMAIRVYAPANGRRVLLTVLGDGTNGTGGVTNTKAISDANNNRSYLQVQQNWKLNIKILDGQPWNDNNNGAVKKTSIVPNWDGAETSGERWYGEPLAGNLATNANEVLTGNVPVLGNTLCINATAYASDLVFVSFASKNDKFTFTGDSQIAHVGAAASISLKNCKSSDLDQIKISSQSTCTFSYKYQAAIAYSCTTGALLNDNLIIQTTSAFGDIGDRYDIKAESLTSGVYFGAAPTLNTYDLVTNKDMCVAGAALAATFAPYKGDVTTGITYDTGSTCSVASTKQVNMVKTTGGALDLDNKNGLRVDLGTMVYDSSVIANGTEAKVKLTLSKYPCGDMFEGTATLGTFVTTCTTASTSTSTLLFPFFPPMDPSAAPGWWGGYIIMNGSSAAGTAALTYTDAAGATATYTTPSVAAGAQFNGTTVTYSMLTAGTGTFSQTENYSVKAACAFGSAAGFAFVSSPQSSASYTAYTNSGSAWQ